MYVRSSTCSAAGRPRTSPLARAAPSASGCVPELAAAIRPGQFVMLRLPGTTDPLLGRPFALYDTVLDARHSRSQSTSCTSSSAR